MGAHRQGGADQGVGRASARRAGRSGHAAAGARVDQLRREGDEDQSDDLRHGVLRAGRAGEAEGAMASRRERAAVGRQHDVDLQLRDQRLERGQRLVLREPRRLVLHVRELLQGQRCPRDGQRLDGPDHGVGSQGRHVVFVSGLRLRSAASGRRLAQRRRQRQAQVGRSRSRQDRRAAPTFPSRLHS